MTRSTSSGTYKIIYVWICLVFYSCDEKKAQRIVENTIEKHGGVAYQSFKLEFDFRNRHYTAARKDGAFTYTRQFADSTGRIKDVLNNTGLVRYRNDSIISISDERRKAFTNSVNSVIYFALLPFGLNDDAVNKQWMEETTIKGEPYHVLRITFDQRGGGEDHEDVFFYWIHQQKNTMDFLAYSYQTDGGGLRFREAVNSREVGGILFQDYVNYKPKDERVPLEKLQSLFASGELEKLSEIKLENLRVGDYKAGD